MSRRCAAGLAVALMVAACQPAPTTPPTATTPAPSPRVTPSPTPAPSPAPAATPSPTPAPTAAGPVGSPTTIGGVKATASRSSPENPPEFAADGDSSTAWTAGAGPDQWIQLELPAPLDVGILFLQATQTPAGVTKHDVWVGASEADLHQVGGWHGYSEERQLLRVDIPERVGPVRVIRIVTTVSPSWVAWREILISTLQP